MENTQIISVVNPSEYDYFRTDTYGDFILVDHILYVYNFVMFE